MAIDRSIRCLSLLSGASSNRVLNLLAIAEAQAANENHRASPLFVSPIINSSIILKHRLRADETQMFVTPRIQATKVIIPFEKKDLRVGGRSLFVDQAGFEALLREVGNYKNDADAKHDMDVLQLIDRVPSLDPFLLREHLRCNDVAPDPCYFEISKADQKRMHDYAAAEISRLTAMASGKKSGAQTRKMVEALLSSDVDEKLEPMRLTLNLPPEQFSEGVFCWRGFLYYKWAAAEFWPNFIKALKDLKAIRPLGPTTAEQAAVIRASKEAVIRGASDNSNALRRVLGVYDDAYGSMIQHRDPTLFKEFLLRAPAMFLEIGERMAAISHVTSFWQYRFPPGSPKVVEPEDLTTIFQDFTRSFGLDVEFAA